MKALTSAIVSCRSMPEGSLWRWRSRGSEQTMRPPATCASEDLGVPQAVNSGMGVEDRGRPYR